MTAPPCRLFVIMAHRAREAVIIRRGPSAWHHLVHWNLDAGTFDHGAWFAGMIYAEKCDLSPDGQLFLGSFHKGSRHGSDYTSAWTAVSRTPWLHALGLWPAGMTWGGGGRFLDRRKLCIRLAEGTRCHPDHPATGLDVEYGSAPLHETTSEDLEDATWSGSDHRGRLIVARAGKLFRHEGSRVVELADFNGLEPRPEAAPDWATWPLDRERPTSRRARKR